MSRPKLPRDEQGNIVRQKVESTSAPTAFIEEPKEIFKEIIIERIVEVEKPLLKDLALWKELANKGFPQGGSGNWIVDPDDGNKYYVPQPSELYQSFVNDPEGWNDVGEALGRVWVDKNKK